MAEPGSTTVSGPRSPRPVGAGAVVALAWTFPRWREPTPLQGDAAPAPLVDAYLYLKVPGESDGTSDPKARRFDEKCGGDDAKPGAPQAGLMFDAYLIDLLKNAQPPL
jgi:hypothetical protein